MPFVFSDQELAESIQRLGVLLPVIRFEGSIVDGRRREYWAAAKARELPTWDAPSPEAAAAAVWVSHPDRALQLLAPATGAQAAELLGVRPAAVWAVEQARARPSGYSHKRPIRHVRIIRRVLVYLDACEQGIELFTLERVRELLQAR